MGNINSKRSKKEILWNTFFCQATHLHIWYVIFSISYFDVKILLFSKQFFYNKEKNAFKTSIKFLPGQIQTVSSSSQSAGSKSKKLKIENFTRKKFIFTWAVKLVILYFLLSKFQSKSIGKLHRSFQIRINSKANFKCFQLDYSIN